MGFKSTRKISMYWLKNKLFSMFIIPACIFIGTPLGDILMSRYWTGNAKIIKQSWFGKIWHVLWERPKKVNLTEVKKEIFNFIETFVYLFNSLSNESSICRN